MAFMVPVMKNNYDIYKDNRTRKSSECSNGSSTGANSSALSSAMGVPSQGRGRKVSECKSESFTSSPSHQYRMQMQRCQSSRAFPRNSSRISHSSYTGGAMSPTRSYSQSASPPKSDATAESQSEMSKFHLRLVEKLRKSFRRDSNKRS